MTIWCEDDGAALPTRYILSKTSNLTTTDLMVGQIWKNIENKSETILISLVKPKEFEGYMFDGFSVIRYLSFNIPLFMKYHFLFHNPRQ